MRKQFYMQNPWKTIAATTHYENAWIQVVENKVINPAGNPGIYGVVHFKNKATGVVALDEDLHIYLVGQYRYPLNIYSWEIPEGGSPLGKETPLETAKRELLEEAGLIADSWQQLGRIHTSNSVCDEEGFIFLARKLSVSRAQPEETEQLEIKKISLQEAVEWVMQGKITDSISMAGILMAARMFLI